MYTIKAKREDGQEITCALLEKRIRVNYGNHRSRGCSAFQDLNDDEVYFYDCDNDTFIKPKKVVFLG